MIDLCFEHEEGASPTPFNRAALISQLEQSGLAFERVDRPRANATCLLFAAVDSKLVTELSADERSQIVLVADGDRPTAAEAESVRQSLGLLGLVEPRAWRSWKRGLLVAWGLYGRPDIATAVGLVPLDSEGLQPGTDREPLPAVLARFLRGAQP